ncbi:MAG: HEPN domain-containing protein [Acidobacteriota bacterium]
MIGLQLCEKFAPARNPIYDSACFRSQQCAEKYLKARLQEASIASGKTHDLLKLLSLYNAD